LTFAQRGLLVLDHLQRGHRRRNGFGAMCSAGSNRKEILVMPTKYLVLRANVPLTDSFVFSSPSSWSASRGGPTKLSIHTFDGHEHDVGDLRADRQNAAVMDAEVALKLVEPQSKASPTVDTL
jgi:hypothetical protein